MAATLTRSDDRNSRRFCPGAQDFRDTPGLGDAAAGVVRFARIEYFADGPDTSFAQMFGETL